MGMAERNSVRETAVSAGSRWFSGRRAWLGAEGEVDVGGGETAAPAVGESIGAASGVIDKTGFNGLLGHFSFLCGWD